MFKEKKIPTILGLLILLGVISASVFLTNRNTNSVSKASGDCTPQNPQITNITNNSASISFTTDSDCLSSLSIDNQTIENSAVISNDQKSKIHYFDVSNLADNTDYNYSVIGDGKSYDQTSYKFKTAQKPNSPIPSSNLAWGRIFTQDLKPAGKVMIFVNISSASPLSALVTTSGNWNISLANSFNDSKSDRFTPDKNTPEEIIVIDRDKQTTQISANTSQNDPTPDIILGQNQFSPASVNFNTETNTGSLSSITPVPDSKELDILNPKDNDSLSTKKPDFFGTGPINSKIEIQVHSSTVYNGEVTTQEDGSWNWSPPSDLSPGEHTITATTIENGVEKIITRKFTVLAADNQLSYSASPSATTPTPTIIPTSTPIPTIIPTTKPTVIPTSTIKTSKPSTNSGMPTTGNSFPTIFLLSISALFISFSFLSLKRNKN
jgi:hypothetical protein